MIFFFFFLVSIQRRTQINIGKRIRMERIDVYQQRRLLLDLLCQDSISHAFSNQMSSTTNSAADNESPDASLTLDGTSMDIDHATTSSKEDVSQEREHRAVSIVLLFTSLTLLLDARPTR
jgi:hypothetical protein